MNKECQLLCKVPVVVLAYVILLSVNNLPKKEDLRLSILSSLILGNRSGVDAVDGVDGVEVEET